jgi:hypothetical protein
VTAREIFAAAREAEQRAARGECVASDQALIALRDLLASFLEATDKGYPDSLKEMSIDQVRILNQMHLAVGQ